MKNLFFTFLFVALASMGCKKNPDEISSPPVNTKRDPKQWPFAQNSIWNMPIGSSAVYQPAYLLSVEEFSTSPQYQRWVNQHQSSIGYGGVGIDEEPIIFSAATDAFRTVCDIKEWAFRCGGTPTATKIRFPAGLTYQDPNGSIHTPNYSGACIQIDGSVFHFNALVTCGTDKLGCYNYTSPENNTLTGEGKYGGHGGSGLSGIGGSIRKGELLSNAPLRHALKLNLLAAAYLVYNNDATPGYRWPADRSDGYANPAFEEWLAYGVANPNKTTATYMEMGVLLAIKPDVTAASLGITNPLALKIFQALKDYGAYIVDDTHWNHYDWCMEQGVYEEVQANMDAANYTTQMMRIFKNLNAITNNGPNSIGGGGTPRQPLAPPF